MFEENEEEKLDGECTCEDPNCGDDCECECDSCGGEKDGAVVEVNGEENE